MSAPEWIEQHDKWIEDVVDNVENWLREWCCLDHATIEFHRNHENPDGARCLGCRVQELEEDVKDLEAELDSYKRLNRE